MAGSDLLGISSSGAQAAQRSLTTVGHNIANSSTPGYSRQRTALSTQQPQLFGDGAQGTGVVVNSIERYYDEFLVSELRHTTSLSKNLDKAYEYTSQVDNLLSDPRAGLSPAISDFFDSVNGVANDPTSTASRQVLMSSSRNLADRFSHISERMESLRTATNKDMEGIVGQVNELAKGIASLNNAIVRAREVTNRPANDLLDQRDRLVQNLSELINVRTTIQDDGRMNVFIGNGQTLVAADVYEQIGTQINEFDPSKLDVIFKGNSGDIVVSQFLSGGELGGLVKFRDEILDPAQNELGRIAIGISQSFNNQHRLGMNMYNKLGSEFFIQVDQTSPIVLPSNLNKGDMELTAEIIDTNKLSTSNYQLTFREGQYELLRLEDLNIIGRFSTLPQVFEDDGIRLNIAGGAIQDGDRYIIHPTRRAADLFDIAIQSVAEIAAATPIRVEADIDNLGDAEIDVIQVTQTDNPAFTTAEGRLTPPYVVRFVDATHFEILDNTGKAIKVKKAATADDPAISLNERGLAATPAVPATETGDRAIPAKPPQHIRDGKQETASGLSKVESVIEYDPINGATVLPTPGGIDQGINIRINGDPKAGDMFRIEFNKDGISDNKNALALAQLQSKPTLLNGTSDYAQAYGQLVSRVGSRTHEMDINRQAQKLLLDQAVEARESVSGVNLDEEAAELIKFQNLYAANAQVISAANQTFQILLDAFR